jgi:ABC-type Fe3+-siderophore transport system permease subunit
MIQLNNIPMWAKAGIAVVGVIYIYQSVFAEETTEPGISAWVNALLGLAIFAAIVYFAAYKKSII